MRLATFSTEGTDPRVGAVRDGEIAKAAAFIRPKGWDDTSGYGAGEVGKPAFVVVTSSPPESVRLTDLDWTFVTTGLPGAVTAARERAEAASSDSGKDLDVVLMGGGATIGSALDAGLVDALSLHLAPVVLGAGTPLFTGGAPRTLVQRSVISTSTRITAAKGNDVWMRVVMLAPSASSAMSTTANMSASINI